jgi:glycosyltransferase involved in cell wall biosynthesis
VIERMHEFVRKPQNTLWMVAPRQHQRWQKHGLRAPVMGYVPSSYCYQRHVPSPPEIDLVTIGRADPAKDPFRVHRIGAEHGLSTLVMSNKNESDYQRANDSWYSSQSTEWDLPHEEVMKRLKKAASFVSTWPGENYPNTVLEALSRGVPVVMFGDEDGRHGGEAMLSSPEHGRVVATDAEAAEAARDLSHASRSEIARMTADRFSRKWWLGEMSKFVEGATANG